MKKIYFICTGNACRSQIAEGYAKILMPGWEVRSAGVEVHGLNPYAVRVMAEDGFDISQQESKLIDPNYFVACDVIVTLCGDVLDKCPVIPANLTHYHWNLSDPAKTHGDDAEILTSFRKTQALIKAHIQEII